MTGRTNVGVGGIALNANTVNCKVADGYSLVAGDFVEKYTTVEGGLEEQISSGSSSPSQNGNQKIFRLSDGRYIGFAASTATVYELNGDVFIKDLSPYVIVNGGVAELDDDTFAIVSESMKSGSASVAFLFFDVNNNTFTSRTQTVTPTNDSGKTSNYVPNQVVWDTIGRDIYGMLTWSGAHVPFKVTFTGNDFSSYTAAVRYLKCLLDTSTSYTLTGIAIVDNVFAASFSRTDTGMIILLDMTTNTTTKSVGTGNETVLLCDENDYIWFLYDDRKIRKLRIDDHNTLDCTLFEAEDLYQSTAFYYGYSWPSKVYEDSNKIKVIVTTAGTGKQFLISVNKNDHTWTVGPQLLIEESSGRYENEAYGLDEYEFIYFGLKVLKSGSSYYRTLKMIHKYTIESDLALNTRLENVMYVKPITTEQFIKGVAAEDGAAGDTIEVYIPTPSV